MKKILSSALIFCMVLSLAGCGKEQTVSYSYEVEQNGVTITDTMTFDAKGDKIKMITEVMELDMSAFDESQRSMVTDEYDSAVEQYNSVEGAEATSNMSDDGIYTMTVTIDASGDTVSQLSELGLLEIEGNAKGISLKATGESLEASGYTLVE